MESLYTAKVRNPKTRKLGPNALMAWAAAERVEVLAVQLPGRGKRHREPFLPSLAAVADELVAVLTPRLRSPHRLARAAPGAGAPSQGADDGGTSSVAIPYAVLGHSMGCWAAFEFLQRLRSASSASSSL